MKNGFIAISTILIISAVVLGIAVTVALSSIGEGQASLALTKGEQTLHFVEGCAEDALLKIRSNASYANPGPVTITRPEGTCSVSVSPGSPNILTVTTEDTKYKRTIQIQYTRSSSGITMTSWKETP